MFVFSFCFDRYVYVYLIYKWKYLTSVQWRYVYKHKWRKTLFEHKYSTMAQHRQTIWPKLIRMIIDDNLLRWKRNECCRCDLLLLLGITWWIIQPTIIGFRIDSIEKIDFHILLKENSMTFVCFFFLWSTYDNNIRCFTMKNFENAFLHLTVCVHLQTEKTFSNWQNKTKLFMFAGSTFRTYWVRRELVVSIGEEVIS